MPTAVPKTSWAEEVDEADSQPKNKEYIDENGIRISIEYTVNADGKQVKITRRTKPTLVNHSVADRLKWTKFGQENGKARGPDRATTTMGDDISLRISAGNKTNKGSERSEDSAKTKLAQAGAGKVVCRLCKGEHFTAKCPHKETFAILELDGGNAAIVGDSAKALDGASVGKYVPPGKVRRGPGTTDTAGFPRDELPTLRVTNLSEDTQEDDLRHLFGSFGRVVRVFLGRDRETSASKGFAFVSFEERAVAQKAMEKLHGKGYDNLILSVQWSQPRAENS
ncbi:eukaryotic translation initiation factor 3 subunit G-domain-containing protein [Mycena crocata]|nr:eukaryotic translation initiation factor 3 subunit G-domain-containing protein [Mycena crocata]